MVKVINYLLWFIFGTCIGSFLYCIVYRRINRISIFKGRSRCDKCDHTLSFIDLIPVFSFVFNRGRCRYCGYKLDTKYLYSELIMGFVFLLSHIKYGYTIKLILYLVLFSLLFLISLIDLDTYIINDEYLILIWIIWIILYKKELFLFINGVTLALFVYLIRIIMGIMFKKETMGLGDVKLLLVLGMFNNLYINIIGLIIACIIGLIFSYISKKRIIPFGPCICLAYYIVILLV